MDYFGHKPSEHISSIYVGSQIIVFKWFLKLSAPKQRISIKIMFVNFPVRCETTSAVATWPGFVKLKSNQMPKVQIWTEEVE